MLALKDRFDFAVEILTGRGTVYSRVVSKGSTESMWLKAIPVHRLKDSYLIQQTLYTGANSLKHATISRKRWKLLYNGNKPQVFDPSPFSSLAPEERQSGQLKFMLNRQIFSRAEVDAKMEAFAKDAAHDGYTIDANQPFASRQAIRPQPVPPWHILGM